MVWIDKMIPKNTYLSECLFLGSPRKIQATFVTHFEKKLQLLDVNIMKHNNDDLIKHVPSIAYS